MSSCPPRFCGKADQTGRRSQVLHLTTLERQAQSGKTELIYAGSKTPAQVVAIAEQIAAGARGRDREPTGRGAARFAGRGLRGLPTAMWCSKGARTIRRRSFAD